MNKELISRFKDLLALKPAQILAAGFAAVILAGALLLNTPWASNTGECVGFINALFTSTSAVCVTGLVVVDTGTYWNTFGKVVIICLIQIGGLGIMAMTTLMFFLMGKRIGLKNRLLMQKALGHYSLSGIVQMTKRILIGTAIVELTGALLLSTRFVPLFGWKDGIFASLFHSISAFCNAGFDIFSGYMGDEYGKYVSIVPFVDDITVSGTIAALIVIGGLSFPVIMNVIQTRNFRKLNLHSKIVLTTTGFLLGAGFLTILLFEYSNPGTMGPLTTKGKLVSAMFHSVSPRTAGFNSLNLANITQATAFITIILMFIGGSPGSTAGGIKTTTFTTLFLAIKTIILGREDTNIFEKRLSRESVNDALAVTGVGLTLVTFVTLILTFTETKATFLQILFETVSAFATVGLTLGITPDLSDVGKLLLSLTMFAGRIGPITLVLAVAGVKEGTRTLYHYPEEKINIG